MWLVSSPTGLDLTKHFFWFCVSTKATECKQETIRIVILPSTESVL